MPPNSRVIAYVIPEYPSVSQTFVNSEMKAMQAQGWRVLVYPIDLRAGWNAKGAEWRNDFIRKPLSFTAFVRSLFVLVLSKPVRVRAIAREILSYGVSQVPRQSKAFVHALNLLSELLLSPCLVGDPLFLHGHFFGRAADVLRFVRVIEPTEKMLLSGTGHAGDVLKPGSPKLLSANIAALDLGVGASEIVAERLRAIRPGLPVVVVHCGVAPQPKREWQVPAERLRILTVARLVEKKGISTCLDAARVLRDRGVAFSWQVVGDGPLRSALEQRVSDLDVSDSVTLSGAMGHAQVHELMHTRADVFVLPCIEVPGDVDGIPVALMEAMSHSLVVVTSVVGGIGELVSDGVTGFVVQSADHVAVADRLCEIQSNSKEAKQASQAGRAQVEARFSSAGEASRLARAIESVARDGVLSDETDGANAQIARQHGVSSHS